jgi:hypothetical protein
VLSDIPILGSLFTKSAPDLSSREAAIRELQRMEKELLTLQDHFLRGLVGETDYRKGEVAVQVMRRSLEATDEELKRTPLTPTELKQRVDSELLKRGLIEPSAPATDAARIRLRAAETELKRALAQRDQGLISPAEYEATETQFKLADAELRGDRATAAQVRLNAAAKTLARATVQRDQGIISNAEYQKAALALELARAEERANAAQTSVRAPAAIDTAGIGVALKEESGHFVIGSILPDSPAANEGSLKPGHEIREIGGSGDQLVSIAGWKLQDVVARLRGKEGTQVSLFVIRSGAGTIVTLIRRKLPELELGREHLKTELATAYAQFDQTAHQGWRALADQKRFGEAAELICAYLDAQSELREDERINLHFHAAQCLAMAGGDKSVEDALEHLTRARYASEPPDAPIRWNDYVNATEAFLRGDLQGLKLARERIASGPKLDGEQANLDVVDRLIANFGKAYLGAYGGAVGSVTPATPPGGSETSNPPQTFR